MAMGSGSSKDELATGEGYSRERRASHIDTNPPPKSLVLVQCGTCKRKFAADRIGRHAEVCAKSQKKSKRRQPFDVQGQRLRDTEAEEMRDVITDMEVTYSATDWKAAHALVLEEIRDAKKGPRPVSALDRHIKIQHLPPPKSPKKNRR